MAHMKSTILSLYWQAKHDLDKMRRSDMKLSERIKFERAMVTLEIMKRLVDDHTQIMQTNPH